MVCSRIQGAFQYDDCLRRDNEKNKNHHAVSEVFSF